MKKRIAEWLYPTEKLIEAQEREIVRLETINKSVKKSKVINVSPKTAGDALENCENIYLDGVLTLEKPLNVKNLTVYNGTLRFAKLPVIPKFHFSKTFTDNKTKIMGECNEKTD